MDNDLTFFTYAHALSANTRHIFQCEMHDAAFAGGHGIEPEWLVRSLHAFRGYPRCHPQLLKT